jgi:hypothetical protein
MNTLAEEFVTEQNLRPLVALLPKHPTQKS